MTLEQALAHGEPETIAPEIIEEAFRHMPGYLWIVDNYIGDTGLIEYDAGPNPCRLIHCGRCDQSEVQEKRGRRWPVQYTQNEGVVCPFCGEIVTVKHVTRGVKGIRHRLNVIWYHKSHTDPGVVVARAAKFTLDYREAEALEPWTLEPDIWPTGMAAFDPAHRDDLRAKAVPIWEEVKKRRWAVTGHMWEPVKSMHRLNTGDGAAFEWQKPETVILSHTLEEAIDGTPLERCWSGAWDDREHHNIKALDLATRCPCVEYLNRLGMTDIVQARLDGDLPTGLINWRGKTKGEVLKLDRDTLGQMKHFGITPYPALLVLLKWLRGQGITMDLRTADRLGGMLARTHDNTDIPQRLEYALNFHDPSRRRKTLKYMAKQVERNRAQRLSDFTDYWHLCPVMGEDLRDSAVAYPSNLTEAENRLLERQRRDRALANAAKNAEMEAKLKKRIKKLERTYSFSFGGLTLRPVASIAELRAEGDTLHHCVGGYAEKYSAGATVICVLRRDVEPDRPWRTVEISPKTGKVVQDRGYHNDSSYQGIPLNDKYRAALDMFWEAWGERKRAG